jgi:hypothetical protein
MCVDSAAGAGVLRRHTWNHGTRVDAIVSGSPGTAATAAALFLLLCQFLIGLFHAFKVLFSEVFYGGGANPLQHRCLGALPALGPTCKPQQIVILCTMTIFSLLKNNSYPSSLKRKNTIRGPQCSCP